MEDPLNGRLIRDRRGLFTLTDHGESLIGERIIREKKGFLREWPVEKSKLGYAISKGLNPHIMENSSVLYLGASAGTTVSYVSDIVSRGYVYAVELSYDPFLKLLSLAERRSNIIPVLEDAGFPERYRFLVESAHFIYQDISQPDQVRIFNLNAEAFSEASHAILVLKARSLGSRQDEQTTIAEAEKKIKHFKIMRRFDLNPVYRSNYLYYLVRRTD